MKCLGQILYLLLRLKRVGKEFLSETEQLRSANTSFNTYLHRSGFCLSHIFELLISKKGKFKLLTLSHAKM